MDGEIEAQLEAIAFDENFSFRAHDLVAAWLDQGCAAESIEPVLRFMERHPEIDFGAPGPLVHFVERFDGSEYEQVLVESLQRAPITHTAWMLNRVINGREDSEKKSRLLSDMAEARDHPAVSAQTRNVISRFMQDR